MVRLKRTQRLEPRAVPITKYGTISITEMALFFYNSIYVVLGLGSELAVLSEAKEEIAILKMVFVDHVMDVVSGDQQLTHFDSLLPG